LSWLAKQDVKKPQETLNIGNDIQNNICKLYKRSRSYCASWFGCCINYYPDGNKRMIQSTITKALNSLGFTDGWAASEQDGIILWLNEEKQPTEAELIKAGWVKPDAE
jgi:hypothetical protein